MNNEVNIEEKNVVTNKVNKNKTVYIIILVISFIICLGVGYIIGSNKHIETTKEKEVDKKNNENIEKQEETTKSTIITSDTNMNSIKADIGKDEKITENIELNGKTLELTYELENYNETWGGTPLFKINNNKIENKSLYGNNCYYIEYKKIYGNDNKEYLLFTYGTYANYLFIINDEGRVIYSINSLDKNEECVAFIDSNAIGQRMYAIKDNNIYFYKAEGEVTYNSEANIELTEIKLIINNNLVKEEKSSSKIDGHFGQCK